MKIYKPDLTKFEEYHRCRTYPIGAYYGEHIISNAYKNIKTNEVILELTDGVEYRSLTSPVIIVREDGYEIDINTGAMKGRQLSINEAEEAYNFFIGTFKNAGGCNGCPQGQKPVAIQPEGADGYVYSNPIGVTQQFRFCGNPLRVDTYKGCDFGCLYCFANSRQWKGNDGWGPANMKVIENYFRKAFETEKEYNDVVVEMLRQRVPLHLGGMSDPFQMREWGDGLSYQLFELCNKYKYPIILSTKTAGLPQKYWDILDPSLVGFQISLFGFDEDYLRKYETHSPTPQARLNFMKKLKEKGFWVSMRIQPLVNLDQALKLIEAGNEIGIDYCTVEHLKIPNDNHEIRMLFAEEFINQRFYIPHHGGKNYEVAMGIKIRNVEAVKAIAKMPIGCGDNDLHHMSQSRNCCGVDTMPEAFNNWMKYNLTYLVTGEQKSYNKEDLDKIWAPTKSVRGAFNSIHQKRYPTFITHRDFTDMYLEKHHHLHAGVKIQTGNEKVLKELEGEKKATKSKKLF